MCVTPAPFAAFCRKESLPGFGEIKKKIIRLGVEDLCPNGHLNYCVFSMFAKSV